MNKTDAIKRLDAIEKEQAELRKIIEAPEKKGLRWKPEKHELYYRVGADEVEDCRSYTRSTTDFNYNTGNCYKTKAEAEKALEILNRAFELIGDWEPDWDDGCGKFRYYHSRTGNVWGITSYISTRDSGLYFPTKEAAQTMIDEFSDDLFLILGRV